MATSLLFDCFYRHVYAGYDVSKYNAEVLANATAASYWRFPNCYDPTPQQVDEVSFLVCVLLSLACCTCVMLDLMQQLLLVAIARGLCV